MILEKVNSIETTELEIKGNAMSWPGAMIQISNISCISTSDLSLEPFPKWALVIIILGMFGWSFSWLLSLILVVIGGGWIIIWQENNEEKKKIKNLTIMMNSGLCLRFSITDKAFLDEIIRLLKEVLREGGIGRQNIYIDIKNSQFSGNAQVLNHFRGRT